MCESLKHELLVTCYAFATLAVTHVMYSELVLQVVHIYKAWHVLLEDNMANLPGKVLQEVLLLLCH